MGHIPCPPTEKPFDGAANPPDSEEARFHVHVPWMPATADPTRYGKTLQNLAWEVMDFWEWVRPEREERAAREMLLERVSAAAKSLWPQSKVCTYRFCLCFSRSFYTQKSFPGVRPIAHLGVV